jgi:hypothetical protein
MRKSLLVPAMMAAIFAGCPWAAAAGSAQVEFVNPESFTDVGPRHAPSNAAGVLQELRAHLVRQASRELPQGQALHVWITDVDLAGDFEPQQPYVNEVRIVKDIYPPRIDLRFRLADAGGKVLKEGDRKLRDPAFLLRGAGNSSDALRFEKLLIDRWLRDEFFR